MVDVETILKDNPSLSSPSSEKKPPVKVIVDKTCDVPLDSKVIEGDDDVIVVVSSAAPKGRIERLVNVREGIEVLPSGRSVVNLENLLWTLYERGIRKVLLEGGSSLNRRMLDDGLVNEIYLTVAPTLIGEGISFFESKEKVKIEYFRRQTAKALVAAIEKSRSKLRVRQVSWTKQPYIYLLMPMEAIPKDMAYYTDRIEELFRPVFFTGKSRCELGGPTLALDDPEEYRPRLMKMILDNVDSLTKSLGTASLVTVEGLSKPVQVTQIDDQRVELFIDYSLSIEMEK